jgi:hypothetical protein
MQVPPDSTKAVLVLVVAISITILWPKIIQRESIPNLFGHRIASVVVLTLSFAIALYLCIASILAIPVFSETVPDISPFAKELTSQLVEPTPMEIEFRTVLELNEARKAFGDSSVRPSTPGSASPGQPARPPASDVSFLAAPQTTLIDMALSGPIQYWDETYSVLKGRTDNFSRDAVEFSKTAISFFIFSDEGHVDTEATKRHVTILANSYLLWLADYHAAIDQCVSSLRAGLRQLQSIKMALATITQVSTESAGSSVYDQLRNLPRLNYEACSGVKPVSRNYLPTRSGPIETLGLFGFASAWLLKTESPELALIVGLLGFGFFGALATSFIREFRGTPGNELPPLGFIMPALIRGIGAAVLVFLLAKGGAAIFTKGDATPNAYAIFFACFVAAVFSDDVWLWARNRQRNELGGRGGTRQSDDASKAGRQARK